MATFFFNKISFHRWTKIKKNVVVIALSLSENVFRDEREKKTANNLDFFYAECEDGVYLEFLMECSTVIALTD